uniref:VapB-type antitoxin n=1 Tax=Candidatus Methanophaga sp. ANME-1 ERB7 TaxID=2759913 RepID=A0A7G9ZAB6_9EURY|nr:hypothetical protein LOCNCDEO_00011 [Methanosarcinales archaeon ANME-1 ERB7]
MPNANFMASTFRYYRSKHSVMSTKTVYSIRVPVELRKTMEELKEINWQEEIRQLVEELVKNKSKERLLAEAKEIRKDMKADVSAAELIREDRDAR